MILKQMKVQSLREMSCKKPDIEALHKHQEDQSFSMWEKYLVRQKEKLRFQKKMEKEINDAKGLQNEKQKEKLERIHQNYKAV